MNAPTWTKPYCGVTHLEGIKRGAYATVTLWADWAEAYVILPGGGFTSIAESNFLGPDSEIAARAWVEQKARELHLFL